MIGAAILASNSSPDLFTPELSFAERTTGIAVPAGTTNGFGGSGVGAGSFAGFAAVAWPGAAVFASGVFVAVWFALFPVFPQPANNSSAAAPNIIHLLFMSSSPLFGFALGIFALNVQPTVGRIYARLRRLLLPIILPPQLNSE
jgi:hypothetical protein